MSDAEIEQAIKDARQYAGLDSLRKEALEILGDSQRLMNKVQQMLKQEKKTMDKAEKKLIKSDCSALEKLVTRMKVDSVTQEQINQLKSAKQQLEASAGKYLQ